MTKDQIKAALTEAGVEFKKSAGKPELEGLLTAHQESVAEAESKKAVRQIKHVKSSQPGSLRDLGGSVVVLIGSEGTRVVEGVQGNGTKFTANVADALGCSVEELLGSDDTIYTLTAANAYKSVPGSRPGHPEYAALDQDPS